MLIVVIDVLPRHKYKLLKNNKNSFPYHEPLTEIAPREKPLNMTSIFEQSKKFSEKNHDEFSTSKMKISLQLN